MSPGDAFKDREKRPRGTEKSVLMGRTLKRFLWYHRNRLGGRLKSKLEPSPGDGKKRHRVTLFAVTKERLSSRCEASSRPLFDHFFAVTWFQASRSPLREQPSPGAARTVTRFEKIRHPVRKNPSPNSEKPVTGSPQS